MRNPDDCPKRWLEDLQNSRYRPEGDNSTDDNENAQSYVWKHSATGARVESTFFHGTSTSIEGLAKFGNFIFKATNPLLILSLTLFVCARSLSQATDG